MKTINIPPQATEVNALLGRAREEDLLVGPAVEAGNHGSTVAGLAGHGAG